jgi:Ca2+-binding EF-hand superfamily protein
MVDTRRFETTFAMLDKDGDGRVSAAEFKEIMATLGVTYTDESAATAISMMDADGDGLVTLEELAAYLSGEHGPRPAGA